jgi:uncharacterized protein YwqG
VCKDKGEDDKNVDKFEKKEETLEDKVNENDIKTENVEESLEPVDDKIDNLFEAYVSFSEFGAHPIFRKKKKKAERKHT